MDSVDMIVSSDILLGKQVFFMADCVRGASSVYNVSAFLESVKNQPVAVSQQSNEGVFHTPWSSVRSVGLFARSRPELLFDKVEDPPLRSSNRIEGMWWGLDASSRNIIHYIRQYG